MELGQAKCVRCGELNIATNKFCTGCGSKFQALPGLPQPATTPWDDRASGWEHHPRVESSSNRHEGGSAPNHEERREHGTKRKIEKLQHLAAGLQHELKGLEKERKLERKAAQETSHKDKELFIRKAAALRGHSDEHGLQHSTCAPSRLQSNQNPRAKSWANSDQVAPKQQPCRSHAAIRQRSN